MVMNSTQLFPQTVTEELKKDNKKKALFEERYLIGFLSTPHQITSYHARTYWLKYRTNLVTSALVEFQQKINISLNDWFDPQIIIRFSAPTRYAK